MKRHCWLTLFFAVAGCWLGFLTGCQAQPVAAPQQTPNPAQMPRPPGTPAIAVPAAVAGNLEDYLKFDADAKIVSVTNGTEQAHFTFSVTNVSSEEVVINYILGSCHCTVAQLPSQPWKLAPKEVGEFSATMDLAGTPPGESKFKTLTVSANKGMKVLNVTTKVLPDAGMMTAEDRTNNFKMATADRQAVFKNSDCITCHADTAKDAAGHEKLGQNLYTAVCGVCHEAAHRATFVPDLHHLAEPTSAQFWRAWITAGKPGTLMPAFAKVEGGILSDGQIDSLVQYLSTTIPAHPVALGAPASAGIAK
jgi:mono/diheme cytochrome c family protein